MAYRSARTRRVVIEPILGLPEIVAGDDLATLIVVSAEAQGLDFRDGDIITVAQKVVSKAEGRIVSLADVRITEAAKDLAARSGKSAAKAQLILDESCVVLRATPAANGREGTVIVRHRLGFICANAGIDESNTGATGCAVLLPVDPDGSARGLRERLRAETGRTIGIVITDTFGRPWRLGLVNTAIGLAGVPALLDLTGMADADGRPLRATMPAFADEIAAASGLVVDKDGQTPVVLFRGLGAAITDQSASALLRPPTEDLFL